MPAAPGRLGFASLRLTRAAQVERVRPDYLGCNGYSNAVAVIHGTLAVELVRAYAPLGADLRSKA